MYIYIYICIYIYVYIHVCVSVWIFEHLIYKVMYDFLSENNLSPNQSGFKFRFRRLSLQQKTGSSFEWSMFT